MSKSRVRTVRSNNIYMLMIRICISMIFLVLILISFKVYLAKTNVMAISSNKEIKELQEVSLSDDILIVVVNSSKELADISDNKSNSIEKENTQKNNTNYSKTHIASNGEEYSSIGILNIPSLNIKYPILSSCSDELLKISICKYWGSDPNEIGNCCIAGHNWRNSKFFSKLPKIKLGDKIEITDLSNKTLVYKVYDTFYVSDTTDTSCTSQLTNGYTEITLITCSNDSLKRFIVKARCE